jgi:hypothetical protein
MITDESLTVSECNGAPEQSATAKLPGFAS